VPGNAVTCERLSGCPRTFLQHFATNCFRASGEAIFGALKYSSWWLVKRLQAFGGLAWVTVPGNTVKFERLPQDSPKTFCDYHFRASGEAISGILKNIKTYIYIHIYRYTQ